MMGRSFGGRGYGRGGDSDWAGRHEGAGPLDTEWGVGCGSLWVLMGYCVPMGLPMGPYVVSMGIYGCDPHS